MQWLTPSLQLQMPQPQRSKGKHGFTIVELLIVIVVIAILAAITVFAYNGVTKQATEATMRSDLQNGATSLEIDKTTSNSYPLNSSAANNGQGLKASGGNQLAYRGGGSSFCLDITNPNLSSNFHLSDIDNQIKSGPCGAWSTTVAGSPSNTSTGYADGTGAVVRFSNAFAIAIDTTGNIYVADSNSNHCIRKIALSGATTTLAGLCGTQGTADGPGSTARFTNPRGIAVDSAGTVYVADSANNCIRKITPGGVTSTLAGTCGTYASSYGYSNGIGAAAKFYFPIGLAADNTGNLYVADASNNCIRKINIATATPSTVAGSCGAFGDFADGASAVARFSFPNQIAFDGAGNLYVADDGNNRIRKITPGGVVSTPVGSTSGFADGTGNAALFDSPDGVTVDSSGTIYVSDSDNNRIRKIASGGVVTTIAGTGTCTTSDGSGTSAEFCWPQWLVVNPSSSDLYVSDFGCNCIRKISL